MQMTRRDFISSGVSLAVTMRLAWAQAPAQAQDRVFICNEDSNTLSVIDPERNQIAATVNLTSFDEDPRPPFRYVTGGVIPTHVAMVRKPLYHGAIDIHGAAPSPDNILIATTERGTSNVYLIETAILKVLGNTANPQAGPTTNPDQLSSRIIVGREPHELTFTRNRKSFGSRCAARTGLRSSMSRRHAAETPANARARCADISVPSTVRRRCGFRKMTSSLSWYHRKLRRSTYSQPLLMRTALSA
jgi:YVTN family beta-propeller protein